MIHLESLQQDHAALSQILESRRGVTTVTMNYGERVLWNVYLTILEDALSILNSLIDHLTPRT